MTAIAVSIHGGHGYAEHGRIRATVAGTTKPLRADGAVSFEVPTGASTIAIDVTVRRPPWATAHGFGEDDLETAHIDLDLHGKQYGIRWPMHPRVLGDGAASRGGNAVHVALDYRFIDVTRYYLRGEVYAARHPERDGHPTLSALDPATNGEKPGPGSQRRPGSLSLRFLEWTTRGREQPPTAAKACRLWCVAFPWNVRWVSALDWFVFLVPKGPVKRAKTLLDYDFKIARRYLLDPPEWAPKFLYAPVDQKDRMEKVVDFDSPDAFLVALVDPQPPAALLTQVASAGRPTVLVAPMPDDQLGNHYSPIVDERLLDEDLLALRTGVLATDGHNHAGGWSGTERFGCAGFSSAAHLPFDIARKVAARVETLRRGPELTLIGLIDPPQFTVGTADGILKWQRHRQGRSALVVGGDHLRTIHAAVDAAGGGLEIHPPRPDYFARDPNDFAQAVYMPPEPVGWRASPMTEASEDEISSARNGRHVLPVAKGSTSDFCGWIRSTDQGRALHTLGLAPVPMADSMRSQLEQLSTMELSGYIGWLNIHGAAPRTPVKDLGAIVRKSSDLRHQWAVASGDVLTRILKPWS